MFDLFIWIDYFQKKGDLETVEFIKKCYLMSRQRIDEGYLDDVEIKSMIQWCLIMLPNRCGLVPEIISFLHKIIEIGDSDPELNLTFSKNFRYIANNGNSSTIQSPVDYISSIICCQFKYFSHIMNQHNYMYLGLPEKYGYTPPRCSYSNGHELQRKIL